MLKKACLSVVAMGLMASFGFADVLLNYEPTELTEGVTTDIVLSLTGNDGFSDVTSAVILSYGQGELDALGIDGFAWDGSPDFDNNSLWFVDPALPAPSAVSFGGTLPVVAGELTPVATLTATPGTLGTFSLDANAVVGDANAAPLDVKSGPQAFQVVPEPASLGLLAMGALAAIRRRR